MKFVASVALVVLVVLGSPVVAAAAEPHPGVGVVFDVRELKDGADGGGLDDRFEGGPSFPGWEIDNTAAQYAQNLTILATDTAAGGTPSSTTSTTVRSAGQETLRPIADQHDDAGGGGSGTMLVVVAVLAVAVAVGTAAGWWAWRR